jgi:saccharopine dehydrogenase (NAD+, L-lysine forming)
MNIVIIGAGGVGSALVAIAARRPFFASLTIADVDVDRARSAADRSGDPTRIRPAFVDASDAAAIAGLLTSTNADVVVNACDTRFNAPIFNAAFATGCHYLDMAMHPSRPHATHPYEQCGVKLGDEQFAVSDSWSERGLLAIGGMGVEPGLSDVFARYAADHLFTSVDNVGVRDGSNLSIDGFEFAPTFSIWTTIEECLAPPVIYERNRGWFTTEPFSEPELFDFPGGIGTVECVNVEHEEVLLIPRWIDCNRVTFKYGLGQEFIDVLRTLHKLGLDSTKPLKVGNVTVAPRAVVAAALPNPAELGARMHGKTCAGTVVNGIDRSGMASELYLYHLVDNAWTMNEYGHQAVVWQTAINPVVALELLAKGQWSGSGVVGPEAFDAKAFLDLLTAYGSPWHIDDRRKVLTAA